jgi:hypothetical protein
VLPGNTADSKTRQMFLGKIEQQYGKARRVWVMDRGVPTEAALASDPPLQYLVGTPNGRPNRLEKHLVDKPWQDAREGVKVKLPADDMAHCGALGDPWCAIFANAMLEAAGVLGTRSASSLSYRRLSV